VALPVFLNGGMENWGLITFRETFLLCSDEESSVSDRSRVNAVISHELAHMVRKCFFFFRFLYIEFNLYL
jgi:aminopeptidase N